MFQKNAGRRGFTLIELLVVISIISVLAAILLPVFAQAREKARQTDCLSNLKQIGQAMMMYSSDNDGQFPLALVNRPGELLYAGSWINALQPYARSEQLFLCPSSPYGSTDWRHNNDLLRNYGYAPTTAVHDGDSYLLINADPFGEALWEGIGGFAGTPLKRYNRVTPSRSESQIARPSDTILVCDHPWFDWTFSTTTPPEDLLFPAPRHMRETPIRLPDGRTAPEGIVNCLFVDGHARGLKHDLFWEVRHNYPTPFGVQDVFWHFWPYA